jgi:NTE family protein
MRPPWRVKVGVALGGGAARGLAHIGVLRALVREEIPIDVVVGTSMGSVIGGAYAATGDITAIEKRVREFVASEEFRKNRLSFLKETKHRRGRLLYSVGNLIRRGIVYGVSTMRGSFMSAERFAAQIQAVLPDIPVEETRVRFGAVALDLEAGREVVLCHGRLRRAVAASSAIPGILPPVRLNGRVLVDGGWVDKVPVLPAYRLGAEFVIAVDISADIQDAARYTNGLDVMIRANSIRDTTLVRYLTRMADVVVEPAVKSIHWADFAAIDTAIEAGDVAATAAVPHIREMLRHERWRSVFRPSTSRRLAELHLSSETQTFHIE